MIVEASSDDDIGRKKNSDGRRKSECSSSYAQADGTDEVGGSE